MIGPGNARKKRDTSDKRNSILEAAIQVFSDVGYESSSMDRISEVAKASKRTVYNHFQSKEDLFRAVLERFNQEMKAIKNISYDNRRNIEDQLGDFVDAEIMVAQSPKWMGQIKLLLSVFINFPETAKEAVAKHSSSESSLTAWMRAAALDGKLVADDPELASRVFTAMMGGAFTWPSVYQGGLLDPRTAELKREIISTFLARYGKRYS